jgi:hypothetical protein
MVILKFAILICGFTAFAAETPICITAIDLASQVAHDKEASDPKFKGKALVITGRVNYVRANPREVDLKTDASFLIRASGVNFSSLRPNQLVTLKCIGDGTAAPITVSSCTIEPANTPCIALKKTAPTSGPNLVHITLSPTITGDAITIAGTTDLKDGAVISWDLEHALQNKNPMADLSEHGDTTVKGGKYATTIRISRWPRGNIKVWIGFFPFLKSQPQWARTQYGTQGEKLEGPNVKLQPAGMKTIEIEKTITKQ